MNSRWRSTLALVALLAAAVAAGALPASRWWVRRARVSRAAECRVARDQRQWDDLRRLAADWAAADPQVADPWMFLAEAAQARGDWQDVSENLSRVPETDPKVFPALVELAKLEFGQLNHPLRGEEVCQKLLRLDPRVTFAHERLIQYYTVSLQREKLVQQIRFAIEHEREPPEAYVYLLLLDSLRLGNGYEVNQHWLDAHPDNETFAVARALQIPEPADDKAGVPLDQLETVRTRSEGKLKLVDSLLEKFPQNVELLAYRIEEYILVGETDKVAELLSQAPEAAERDSRFWRYKGWLHETYDELPEAEVAYRQSIAIHPLDWNVWNRLAVIDRRLKKLDEVARLAALVEDARSLRIRIRTLAGAEAVTPEILADLAKYARACGADWVADPLDRRLGKQDP